MQPSWNFVNLFALILIFLKVLTKSLKKFFVEVSSSKVSDLEKFSFHRVLKTLIAIISKNSFYTFTNLLKTLIDIISNSCFYTNLFKQSIEEKKINILYEVKQTKLPKSNYFVKQNALKLIQVHVGESKSDIKP